MSAPTTPEGTRQAAAQLSLKLGARNRARILAALVDAGAGGLTADALEVATGLSGNTVRPRLLELFAAGAVTRTSRSMRTRSGALALLWVAL